MFWTKGKGWWNSPVMAPDDEGAGGGDTGAGAEGADAATVLYPDDKPAGGEDGAVSDAGIAQKNATDEASDDSDGSADEGANGADEGEGEWKPYVDDPAKTKEENDAARLENDLKHPINQVPEDGKYDLTMPEGIEVDQPLLDAIGPVFKELNLSRGHAQMLADKFIEAQTAAAARRGEDWAKTINGWADQAQKDPDMGGAKWDQTKTHALAAVTRFGTPELKQYLETSGAGNHPEIIRLMAKVGAMIGEDVPAISENPGVPVEKDKASILYPDDKPKGK